MRTNSFSANAIGGRGGLFDSGAQAIKDALLAYFQSKRNERQDMRQLRRDERMGERDQMNQAVELARRTGVRPDASQLGWTSPDRINPLLDASVQEHTRGQERAAQERAIGDLRMQEYRQKLAESGMTISGMSTDEAGAFDRGLLARIEAGQAEPETGRDTYYATGGGVDVDPRLAEQWAARDRRDAAAAAAQTKAGLGMQTDLLKADALRAEAEKNRAEAGRKATPKGLDMLQAQLRDLDRAIAVGKTTHILDDKGNALSNSENNNELAKYRDALRRQIAELQTAEQGGGNPGMDSSVPLANTGEILKRLAEYGVTGDGKLLADQPDNQGLLRALTSSNAGMRNEALMRVPASWRIKVIQALRASGVQ